MGLRSLQRKDRIGFEEEYKQWEGREYLEIKRAAKKANAHIYFCNIFSVYANYYTRTTNADKGLTSNICTKKSRSKLNMIYLTSSQGNIGFRAINGRINAALIFKILEDLTKQERNPIFIVVDSHSVFMRKKFIAYTKLHNDNLKIMGVDLCPFLNL